jgi:hypothetical protein
MRGVIQESEDDHGEYEDGTGSAGDGTVSHSNRRQAHSFDFTTGAVKRIQSKVIIQDYRLSILIDKQALFINNTEGYQFLLISQSHYQ